MRGWSVSLAIAVLATTLAAPAAGHDIAGKPAWIYCFRACIAALAEGDPLPSDACADASAEFEAFCRLTQQASPDEGDGGRAFQRFKTCNNLCKGIQQ